MDKVPFAGPTKLTKLLTVIGEPDVVTVNDHMTVYDWPETKLLAEMQMVYWLQLGVMFAETISFALAGIPDMVSNPNASPKTARVFAGVLRIGSFLIGLMKCLLALVLKQNQHS